MNTTQNTQKIDLRFNYLNYEQLNIISNDEIILKGGEITFNWQLEQCGNAFWYICKGYIGSKPIKLTVTKY